MTRGASPDHDPLSIVREEEELLSYVRLRLGVRPPEAAIDPDAIQREMDRIREQMREADHDERPALLMLYERLGHLLEAQGRSLGPSAVDPDRPYFGHLRLLEDGRERDVLIGQATRLDQGLRIVDWRNAPVSRLFYRYAEGDEYDEDMGDRTVSGVVRSRRTVGIREGSLVRVQAPQGLFLRGEDGWRLAAERTPRLSGGAGSAPWVRCEQGQVLAGDHRLGDGTQHRADKHLPEVSALIDPEQWKVITSPESQLVVVRGVAGSGKTTVALHRLAYLNYADRRRFRADRMMVVVWGEGMRRFIGKVLPALGVKGTPVRTWSHWAADIRARLFPMLPRDRAEDTPAVVTRLKLHPVMLHALREHVRRTPGPPTASQVVEDWMHVVTGKAGLERAILRSSAGTFSPAELERAIRWTRHQVDLLQEYLQPEQELVFDEPDEADEVEDEAFLDAEDDALLLRLYQLRVGPLPARGSSGSRLRYSHLVVDEVQDLSPLEVRVLLDCTDSQHSATLSGDTQQHVLQEAGFSDWDEFFRHLGIGSRQVRTLKVAYRCSEPILRFARHVLGDLALGEEPAAARDGCPVEILPFEDHGECTAFLADALRALGEAEPDANVALLARAPATADLYFDGLTRAGISRLRRVHDQDFAFSPGVEVTEIVQAKGLEFDYVVLLDISAASWPDTHAARRLLHVGATRAAHQLWVTVVGRPSPLLG